MEAKLPGIVPQLAASAADAAACAWQGVLRGTVPWRAAPHCRV